MQKISTVALSVQKLGWGGGNFYPPPIRLAYIKKPIPNRVKASKNRYLTAITRQPDKRSATVVYRAKCFQVSVFVGVTASLP